MKLKLFASIGALALVGNALAWDAPTYGDTSIAMGDSLNFGGPTLGFTDETLGTWKLNGVLTGLGGIQSNVTSNTPRNYGDVSNAQAVIAKPTGLLQLFAVVGAYSIPDLTTSYLRAATQTRTSWGVLPVAYASIGLLWGQTNSITQGIQVNYQQNDWTSSIAWTDGADSGKYNWLGISAGYRTSVKTAVTAIWNGSLSGNTTNSARTPILQNNYQIAKLQKLTNFYIQEIQPIYFT